MKAWFLVLHVNALLGPVLASLPAPVNPFVNSTNFHNVLCWDPGPGTPPGTSYQIFQRSRGGHWRNLYNSTTTRVTLKLNKDSVYDLMVQASNNSTLSAYSPTVNFSPYMNTKIGPPRLSVAGCGNCIHINISLPKAEKKSRIADIQEYYAASFSVRWRKNNDVKSLALTTKNKSFTLSNLEAGVEYCVQVHMKMHINNNTEPSAWSCTFTSPVEPNRGPAVLGAVAALLIFGIIIVTVNIFCLHYTGFLCKLKAALPTGLNTAVNHGYTLTLERMIPDQIILRKDTAEVKRPDNRMRLPDAAMEADSETEDESEKEGSNNLYMDRDLDHLSSENSRLVSGNVSEGSAAVAAGDSGSFTERRSAEVEARWGEFDGGQNEAEGLEDRSTNQRGPAELQVTTQGEEIEEELQPCSGSVDLFTVTLAALDAGTEEEGDKEQIGDEHLAGDRQEPLLLTDVKWTLNDTDYQTKSDPKSVGTPTQMVPEGMHEETEEEEEEEFSEYFGHR